jgi:HPt (histidine-containing phosphotransfer) domain-containing protein
LKNQEKNDPVNVGADSSADLSKAGIDPVAINRLIELMGQEAFFEFIEPCITRTKSTLDKIPGTIANHDIDGLHLVFHTLKGSSANIGLTAFSSLCAKIDDKVVQRGADEAIEKMLIEARQQLEVSKQGLEMYISQQQAINNKVA